MAGRWRGKYYYKEAERLTNAARYERTEARQAYRTGHYERNLLTTSGNVRLKVPKLRIYGKSQFIYYALADGIFNILKKTREGIVAFLVPLKHPPSQQVTIFKALGIKGCEQYAYCVYSGTPKP